MSLAAAGAAVSEPEHGIAARWLARVALVAVATTGFALMTGAADGTRPGFRPPPRYVSDFTQDWLSARDVVEGRPAYGDLSDAIRRHFDGGEPPQGFLHWNAHPPGSVLVVLPLAHVEHTEAFFLWNLITFPLFVVAVGIVLREFGFASLKGEASAALVIALAGATCYPLYHQVLMGQFNALLAFLLTVAWAADRNGRWGLAGTAVGLAAAIKLFPAFLMLYFVAAGRWRAAAVAGAVGLAVTGLAVGLLGVDAFRTYARDVVPAVTERYATQWNNLTIRAFWLRMFDPTEESHIRPLIRAPWLGHLLAGVSRFAVVVLVGLVAWRARLDTAAARDRAFATAMTGMILVSPIAWPHYLIMLVAPVAVLLAHQWNTPRRWALGACIAVLWLPEKLAPTIAFGADYAADMINHIHPPMSPAGYLLVASVQFYALLGLFVLSLVRSPSQHPGGEQQEDRRPE